MKSVLTKYESKSKRYPNELAWFEFKGIFHGWVKEKESFLIESNIKDTFPWLNNTSNKWIFQGIYALHQVDIYDGKEDLLLVVIGFLEAVSLDGSSPVSRGQDSSSNILIP